MGRWNAEGAAIGHLWLNSVIGLISRHYSTALIAKTN